MTEPISQMREIDGARPDRLPREATEPTEPLLLRGLVKDWPVVSAARESVDRAIAYLRRFYRDATVNAVRLAPHFRGRVFYNDDLSGFNFEPFRERLDSVLEELRSLQDEKQPPTVYVGSTTVDTCLPGFREENDLVIPNANPLTSIWLGNHSRVAAHFDVPDNIACCVAGRRQVIVFPPAEIANLYPGPMDFTPAGQIVSMVDFHHPDPERFPRFESALRHAQVAELEPGDAVVIPSLWWHHVEAEGPFNVLINYWWRRSPEHMDLPTNVLQHALLALRDLPLEQRRAWRDLFDYYVFDFDRAGIEYLPEQRRGILGSMDDMMARKLRAQLLNALRR